MKAVGLGTAVVRLSVGGKSASCKITVVQPVTSIGLNMRSLSLEALDTFQLVATVKPNDAYDARVAWSSSDESVATVDDTGLVTAVAGGQAIITVEALDGSGVKTTITVNVAGGGILAQSVEELESAHPYALSFDQFWQYRIDGAEKLFVTFDDRTEIEEGFDFLYVLDGQKKELGKYTGTALAGKTIEVPGDTVRIRLVTDDAGDAWGFKVTAVETVAAPVAGDADGDGTVSVTDVQLIFRYASGEETVVAEGVELDLNGDGQVNNKDAILLFRRATGGK